MDLLPRLGSWIAALSGAALLGSLFVDWYEECAPVILERSIAPPGILPPCPPATAVSGWESLGPIAVVLAVTAGLGFVPAWGALALRRRSRPDANRAAATEQVVRWVTAAVALAALAAAVVVALRISHPPQAVGPDGVVRLAGSFIALAAALGIAGGAMLAAAGDRLFDRVRRPAPALIAIAAGVGLIVASLFLPWYGDGIDRPTGAEGTLSAWEALRVADVLIVFAAAGMALGSAITAVVRWRAAFLVLALGGWAIATLTVLAVPYASLTGPLGSGYAHRIGYYLALAACAAIAAAGLGAATHARR